MGEVAAFFGMVGVVGTGLGELGGAVGEGCGVGGEG
jgi:hypothetical protein